MGSSYGGWWVPDEILRAGTIAYCVGAGEDITFDLELWRRGCTVRVCDPTPRAIAHVQRLDPHDERFQFAPLGLWTSDTTLKFYEPRDPKHVSYSALNIQQTTDFIEVEVRTLASLQDHFGDHGCDILKIDIEGAEIEVLADLKGPVLPKVLCVEFDQPRELRKLVQSVRHLQSLGYSAIKVEKLNVLFVR